jgi:peptidoglycan/LPS O-acetylase OafA/YrhL
MRSTVRDPGLDGLRATAALAVLFAHGGYYLFPLLPHYDAYALLSWLGTEVFFALAGFLAMRSVLEGAARDAPSALRHVAWRGWRLLPLYWMFIAVHAGLALAAGRTLPDSLGAYALGLQNLAWPHPDFFSEAWNLPLFLLLALGLPALTLGTSASRRGRDLLALLLAALIVLAIALRALWVLEHQPEWDEGVRKVVLLRLDATLYGALAAWLLASGRLSSSARASAWTAAATLGIGAMLFLLLPRDQSPVACVGLFVLAGIGAAALCLACRSRSFPKPTAMAAIARWSYALYLVNFPMLFALSLLGLGTTSEPFSAALRFVLWFGLSLLAAAAVHRWIERPLLAAFPRRD